MCAGDEGRHGMEGLLEYSEVFMVLRCVLTEVLVGGGEGGEMEGEGGEEREGRGRGGEGGEEREGRGRVKGDYVTGK